MNYHTIGIFEEHRHAHETVSALRAAGVDEAAITLLTSAESDHIKALVADEPEESALTGALLGTGIGSTLGLLGAIALLPIPGVGLTVASGAVAVLSGSAIGSYLGALYGTRAETEPMLEIKNEISADSIIAIVTSADANQAQQAEQIMSANHCTWSDIVADDRDDA